EDAAQMRERVESLLTEDQRDMLDRRSRAVLTPRGALRRAPEARRRVPTPEARLRLVPEARARMRAPRVMPSPEMRRAPVAPRAPRVLPAPDAPRVLPAPRPSRVRRSM